MGPLGLSMMVLQLQERYIAMLSCYRAFGYRHCTPGFACYACTSAEMGCVQ
jgi:hypothetical protein